MIIVAAIFLLCIWLVVLHRRSKAKWGALDAFPGPWGIPLIGNVLNISPDQQKSIEGMFALSQQYNGIFKMNLGPLGWTVLVSDPKYMEQIMGSTVHINKAGWYRILAEWIGNGMATTSGPKWKNSRKLIAPVFNTKLLQGFTQKFDARNREFIKELKIASEKPFDISDMVYRNTFLNVIQTLIGDDLEEQTINDYLLNANNVIQIVMRRVFSLKVFNNIFKLSKDYKEQRKSIEAVRTIILNIIKKRRIERGANNANNSVKKAFLDLLLDIQVENPDIPDIDIIQQVDTFMFAGHETIASSLNFGIYELSCNRNIQEKLFEESNKIFGKNLSAELTLKELESAEYLDMFCKETLRLYSPVPMISRTTTDPLRIDDVDLPIGTTVMMLIYCMQRTDKYYPDPKKFDPERFSPENKGDRSEYAHAPFSHGLRNCIGQRFALVEMKSTITMLVRNFIISKGDPNFEVTVGQAGTLIPLNGVLVRLEAK